MLVFSFASSAFADSYEPNDTIDRATYIVSYGTVYAKISSPTDVDWFSWANRYGTHSVTLTAPSGYTYYAELYSNIIGVLLGLMWVLLVAMDLLQLFSIPIVH